MVTVLAISAHTYVQETVPHVSVSSLHLTTYTGKPIPVAARYIKLVTGYYWYGEKT